MRGHIDLLIDRARELLGLDESWQWCRLELVGPIEGRTAVKIELGQKKGAKWLKPFHSIHLSLREEEANADAWTRRTGKCSKCMGDGKEIARISVRDGTTWRPCARCKGADVLEPTR